MSELNKDGLVPGQEVDFETIARVNHKRKEAVKNESNTNQPKVRKRGKPTVSNVEETAEQKEADKE
jgi:hypothetical protein